ncbi:MAG: fibronectin type III domain-containing protein [Bacteroidetes bacterium]|nr:fibronectin type III domain-containing protein [Bacteroidota bacterium]
MKRIFFAVMHCTPKQFGKLFQLLNKVIGKLTANSNIYGNPDPSLGVLQNEVVPFEKAIADAKKGGSEATEARNKEALKVHGLLKEELTYVNKVAKNDKDTILLSGFDASEEPEPAEVPDAPVIKKIDDGDSPGTAKIFLAKTTSPLLTKKQKLTFIIEMTTTVSDESSFKTVLLTHNSKKLIVPNLVRGQEVFIRISVMNARGQSNWSTVVSFISRTGVNPPSPSPNPNPLPPAV